MWRAALLLLASGCLCFGQLDSNSVTIQASRTMVLQPDVATFSITVSSSSSTSLDQVVTALQGAGITSANLSAVDTMTEIPLRSSLPETSLVWTFSLSVPFTTLKNTVATLSTLEGNLAQQSSGLALRFSVQGSDVSPQLRGAQTCPIPDLVADARAQAKKLTDAAGLGLGPILALADSPVAVGQWFDVSSFRSGDFSSSPIIVPFAGNIIPASSISISAVFFSQAVSIPVPCSAIVKFALLRN